MGRLTDVVFLFTTGLLTRDADGVAADVKAAFPRLMDAIVREEWEGAAAFRVDDDRAEGDRVEGAPNEPPASPSPPPFWSDEDERMDARGLRRGAGSRLDPPLDELDGSSKMDQSVFFTAPSDDADAGDDPNTNPKPTTVAEVAWETWRENQLREHPGAP